MKHILLIGGHEETVMMAASMQAKWSLFQKEELITDLQKSVCQHVFIQDYEDVSNAVSLAKQLHQIEPIDVVLSFTEYGLEAAAMIQESLNIAGSRRFPVEVTRDKIKMRDHLSDWEAGAIKYQACYTFDDFKSFFISVGKKVVLKPGKGSGSVGISTASALDELQNAWDKTTAADSAVPYIVEEFLHGKEFSVESMSFGGEHEVIAITEKMTTGEPGYVEIGHQLPADLSKECQRQIEDFIITFMDKIKHETGPVHTEIRLCEDGPKLIEANTRPGGDFIWEMVAKGCGVDLVRETIEYYISGGKYPRLNGAGAAAVRYIAFENMTVKSVSGLEDVKALDFVVRAHCQLKAGDKLGPVMSSDDRQGFIVVTGGQLCDAVIHADKALAMLNVERMD